MILTLLLMGAHHQKQGADSYDRKGFSPRHVLQTRLGALSTSRCPNHRTVFILLAAAGIDTQIVPITEALPLALDTALAWTVCEGVTNIIQHSRARHCLIELSLKNSTVGVEVLS